MIFALEERRRRTGADWALRVWQVASLLPVIYAFSVSVYPYLLTRQSVLTFLFDLGVAVLPRAEALGLSLLYHLTASEVLVTLAAVALALVGGVVLDRLLRGKLPAVRTLRVIWAAWLAADLILRLLPIPVSGLDRMADIAGFAVRLACLALVLLDLILGRRAGESSPA